MTLPSAQVYPEKQEKVCTICFASKLLDEFEKNLRGKFGRHSQCRECRRNRVPCTPRKNYYKTPPQERFWACVTKTEDCWEWHGPQDHGYGIVSVTYPDSTIRYKNIRANRFSWELHNGPIPDGLRVCHRCDNPPCCNPDHLFLGTDEDNAHDMWNKGRGVKLSPSIGVNNVNAKLKDEDIPKIRALLADHSMTQNEIAKVFNVTKKVIWQIRHGKTWTHVP